MKEFRFWQIITFQFLHQVPMPFHLFFNCLGLYFFGRAVRTHSELGFSSDSTLPAGFRWNCPTRGGASATLSDAAVIGASAGVMGLLAAYATLFRCGT